MRVLCAAIALCFTASLASGDWPQFMRNSAHTGDAADETLRWPLKLVAQVKLDDAVVSSPAVVDGRAYVVDQMGTAYCIDPRASEIVWQTSPDGKQAMGYNTSSPCVTKGRVYFGTTAGEFHILNAVDGTVVKSLHIGAPIISSSTLAEGVVYFQALDAVLRCIDLDGRLMWTWDHYARYREPPEISKRLEPERGHPGSYDLPHYGGGEVAVEGRAIVTSFGWDIVCLENLGDDAKLRWCNRAPNGRDGASPISSSICGDWIYTAGMGADGHTGLSRIALASGEVQRRGSSQRAFTWITTAVRGSVSVARGESWGRNVIEWFDHDKREGVVSWQDETDATPLASSPVLTKDHLLITTLRGELVAVPLDPKSTEKPQRFATPHGKGIGSTPVVDGGNVYFGCDDGYFYALGPDGTRELQRDEKLSVHQPRARDTAADALALDWPSTYGNAGNTSFQDDKQLAPPLRVRWATRGFGHQLSPCVASGGDLFTITLSGLITCQEQATGRLRWRTQLRGAEWPTSSGMLAHDGKLFVPRPTFGRTEGAFFCLDQQTGELVWSADIGGRYIWERAAPVVAGDKIAFGFGTAGKPPGTMIQAWNTASGKPAWQVELNVAGGRSGSIGGCTDGKTMYFTAGAQKWQWQREGERERGETVALDAATGEVRWRTHEIFGETYPVLAGERLLLNCEGLRCLQPSDGKVLWTRELQYYTRFSVGDDFLVMRGYGGHGEKIRLADGTDYPNCKELGGPTHSCSSVSLTPRFALAATVGGMQMRDVATGELVWQSPGFAPRGCVNPALAGGRVFWPSAASGVVYCWENAK